MNESDRRDVPDLLYDVVGEEDVVALPGPVLAGPGPGPLHLPALPPPQPGRAPALPPPPGQRSLLATAGQGCRGVAGEAPLGQEGDGCRSSDVLSLFHV